MRLSGGGELARTGVDMDLADVQSQHRLRRLKVTGVRDRDDERRRVGLVLELLRPTT